MVQPLVGHGCSVSVAPIEQGAYAAERCPTVAHAVPDARSRAETLVDWRGGPNELQKAVFRPIATQGRVRARCSRNACGGFESRPPRPFFSTQSFCRLLPALSAPPDSSTSPACGAVLSPREPTRGGDGACFGSGTGRRRRTLHVVCDEMREQLATRCDEHGEDCADVIIRRWPDGRVGIPIDDGGSSVVLIQFCPWCGRRVGADGDNAGGTT